MENENASGNVNMSNLLANLNVVLTYLAKKTGDKNNKNNKNALFRGNNNYVSENSNDEVAQYTSSIHKIEPMWIRCQGDVMSLEIEMPVQFTSHENSSNDEQTINGGHVPKNSDDKNNKNAVFKDSNNYNVTVAPSSSIYSSEFIRSLPSPEFIRSFIGSITRAPSSAIREASSSRITLQSSPGIKEEKKEGANLLNRLDLLSVVKNLKENEKIDKLSSLIIQLIKENGGHVPGYAIDPTGVGVHQRENVETLTQFTSHENSSNDKQTIKVK